MQNISSNDYTFTFVKSLKSVANIEFSINFVDVNTKLILFDFIIFMDFYRLYIETKETWT